MEVPRLGVKQELQMTAWATATPAPQPTERVQRWNLHIMDTMSRFLTHWATMGTPKFKVLWVTYRPYKVWCLVSFWTSPPSPPCLLSPRGLACLICSLNPSAAFALAVLSGQDALTPNILSAASSLLSCLCSMVSFYSCLPRPWHMRQHHPRWHPLSPLQLLTPCHIMWVVPLWSVLFPAAPKG